MAASHLFPGVCALVMCAASLSGCLGPSGADIGTPGFSSCDREHDLIEQAFVDAARCDSDADCTAMRLGGDAIEFGCEKPVNKAFDQEAMYNRIREYSGKCARAINDCGFTDTASCKGGRCALSDG